MKASTVLLIGGVAYLAYKAYQVTASALSLQFGIAAADVNCSGILCTQPELKLKLRVSNPGPGSFTINSLAGSFKFNGVYAGTVSSFEKVQVEPYSEVIYPVVVRVQLASLITQIGDLFSTGIRGELSIEGSLNASGIQVPVITSYRFV